MRYDILGNRRNLMLFKKTREVLVLVLILSGVLIFSACSQEVKSQASHGTKENNENKEAIIFTNAGWESIGFHNAVAGIIIEEGYGFPTEEIIATEQMSILGLQQGDVNIYMEIWTGNIIDKYNIILENGDIIELGINYADNEQGLYVPTYVIEGDPERGIEPLAPDLKSIKDLEKYWEVFLDEEDATKGRIYGSISGWTADEVLQQKLNTYGLDQYYNYFQPGSDAALSSSIASAYESGEPWVGYYWEPTWVTGKYDLILLEDDPYDDEKWNDGYSCKFPSQNLTIAVDKNFPEAHPQIVDFLKNYKTSSEITSTALAYMQDNNVETREAAKWFLKEYEGLWTEWVPQDIAEKVLKAL